LGVEFRILGALEVVADGRQVPVTGARERALLAILLIHAGEVVPAERLIGELWGSDLPANPSNALQMVVSRVRRALEALPGPQRELLVTRKPGYLLDVAPRELDARRFGQLAGQARQVAAADPSLASSLLAEALGLWRGPALAEFALEDFAREEIARLEEARVRAVELKIEAEVTTTPRSNLPVPVTSFVGRHSELRDVGKLLAISRLVTVTGPGGCGKTRLALEVAKTLLGSFPDGVWLVELEAVTDPALVARALGASLGIRDGASLGAGGEVSKPLTDKLVDYLREKELLIVLDNCEHLIKACARLVERLLRSAPRVRFLVTSQECLGVAGEVLWPVPPLAVPGPQEVSPGQLARSDAVRLFADRAAAVQPAFALGPEAALAVGRICRRLDGIPLAIELAAAQVLLLSPQEIAARLDDHFDLLTSGNLWALPQHQRLQAAIDWSYELLSVPERALFRRLSVFAGGFTLEAAEEVCGEGGVVVLELLPRLVDQSLVVPLDSADARFRMLETLRRYAAERLVEPESLHRRHAEYLLRLAERAEPLLRGPQQAIWLRRLEADQDNFSAAIAWACGHDPELAARLSSAQRAAAHAHGA
jgi:predicted ATPase/DNA-binding winged helix-turn-helix (wHTH) protein